VIKVDRIRPVKRLGDELYAALAAMIERHEMPEGTRLPAETALAEQYGVSRPTVRETLARLREEGLIASRRGSGSFVQARQQDLAPPAKPTFREVDSFEQIKQCYQFRMAVEGDAALLAAENRTEAHLAAIRKAIDELDRSFADRMVGAAADFRFHAAVARASGNSWFASALEAMRSQIEITIDVARRLSLSKNDEHLQRIQSDHAAIFDAIKARDAAGARSAMREHLAKTCDRLLRGPRR